VTPGFPTGFLWGAATSHHQVEGGVPGAIEPSDWTDWTRDARHVADGTTADRACGWWHGKAEDDLSLARSLGHGAHRLGISWARIEPEEGRWDDGALLRYAAILEHAKRIGLATSVTLHHFTLPRWVAARGGFGNDATIDRFARFCARATARLSPLVTHWATFNEPSVYAMMSHGGKAWPPGEGSAFAQVRVLARLLRAHAAAVRAIRVQTPDASIGIVLNAPAFDPDRPERRRDRAVTFAQDHAFTGCVLEALASGRLAFPLAIAPTEVDGLLGSFDWLGLNYYGRYRVRFDPGAAALAFGRHVQKNAIRHGDVDWGEPHPAGLTRQLERFAALGRPVYVTENGVFDPTDEVRQTYLVGHVRAVRDAIDRGADVRGYFHWSLLDNFEWAEGYTTPFGLIAVDRTTGVRTPRPSAAVYRRIIEEGLPRA
jgi:beta-glucosidase